MSDFIKLILLLCCSNSFSSARLELLNAQAFRYTFFNHCASISPKREIACFFLCKIINTATLFFLQLMFIYKNCDHQDHLKYSPKPCFSGNLINDHAQVKNILNMNFIVKQFLHLYFEKGRLVPQSLSLAVLVGLFLITKSESDCFYGPNLKLLVCKLPQACSDNQIMVRIGYGIIKVID